jgi:hypothetical protein
MDPARLEVADFVKLLARVTTLAKGPLFGLEDDRLEACPTLNDMLRFTMEMFEQTTE